jgi:hypothetical protein
VVDAEVGAGVAPGEGPVAAAVVGEHSLDRDAALVEPRHRSIEHADRGGGLLIGADLGIGQAGLVIDDGVHECGADERSGVLAALAGALRRGDGVGFALLTAEELVPAAVGDVAELGDVDVDQGPGVGVFVAS